MNLHDLEPITHAPFHGVLLPSIDIPLPLKLAAGAKPDCTNLEFITQLCRNGYRDKVAKRISKEEQVAYVERIRSELDTIQALGFLDYILMIWDICQYADEKRIPRGPGRGSAASSLVCYLIGVTELDPVEHGLFFARFLSKARAKTKVVEGVTYCDGGLVPDVDLDFSHHRRSEIFNYLRTRYPSQTCKLLTTTTLTSKSLIIDVLKVYEGASVEECHAASDLIERQAGVPEELEDALSDDPDKENKAFKAWAKDHKDTVEIAMALSGLNRNEGQHASALLICAFDIQKIMPLQLASDDEGNRDVVSGYDMYSAQEIVLKYDILGLKALDVIEDATQRVSIDPKLIDIHGEGIYRTLQDFKHRYGVFQLETFAQGNAAAKVKPRNFEQLAAILAIARPGAFAYLDQYVKYVNEGVFNSIHPLIDDILRPTGGVCVYQEQFLAMLVRVGLTADSAETIRKIVGKKLKDKVPEAKANIAEVCKRNGHPPEIVDLLLKIAQDSGGYAFNKSHAASYAIISARCLHLKLHHPIEFYWATLQMNRYESNKYEKLAVVEREMRANGFRLLPPTLSSAMEFVIEDPKTIRFALGMVRGIQEKSQVKLEVFIGSGGVKAGATKFEVFQALLNADLNVGIGAALVQAGCMDDHATYTDKKGKSYKSRSRLVLELCLWNKSGLMKDKERQWCMEIGDKPEVQWDVQKAILYLNTVAKDEKGRPLIKDTRLGTIKKAYEPYKQIFLLNSRNERLANFFYERKVLGYSYSETLRSLYGDLVDGLISIAEALEEPKDSRFRIIGFAVKPVKGKTKKGNDELRFELVDETGEIRFKAFNDKAAKIEEANGRGIEEDDLVVCNCKKMDGGTVFAEWGLDGVPAGIQTAKIYTKLSELEAKKKGEAKSAAAAEPTPAAT